MLTVDIDVAAEVSEFSVSRAKELMHGETNR